MVFNILMLLLNGSMLMRITALFSDARRPALIYRGAASQRQTPKASLELHVHGVFGQVHL